MADRLIRITTALAVAAVAAVAAVISYRHASDSTMGEMLNMSLHRERGAMVVDDLTALPGSPTDRRCSP